MLLLEVMYSVQPEPPDQLEWCGVPLRPLDGHLKGCYLFLCWRGLTISTNLAPITIIIMRNQMLLLEVKYSVQPETPDQLEWCGVPLRPLDGHLKGFYLPLCWWGLTQSTNWDQSSTIEIVAAANLLTRLAQIFSPKLLKCACRIYSRFSSVRSRHAAIAPVAPFPSWLPSLVEPITKGIAIQWKKEAKNRITTSLPLLVSKEILE
jgi:hypothetical protein